MGDRRRFLPRLQQSSPPPGHLPASTKVKGLSKPITQFMLFVFHTAYGHPNQPNSIVEQHSAVFICFVLWPTKHNYFTNYHTRTWWNYRLILVSLRELVYAYSNTWTCNKPMWKILIVNCIANICIWNTCVTWQGIDFKLPENDTIVLKRGGVQ